LPHSISEYFTFLQLVCCLAFQLGSIDYLGPAVKKLGDMYHPPLPLAIEAVEITDSHAAGMHIDDCSCSGNHTWWCI